MRRLLPLPCDARWFACVVALVCFAFLPPGAVCADDESPDDEAPDDDPPVEEPAEELEPLTASEAAALAKRLTSAAKRRKAEDILPVLDEVGLRSHPSFRKPLLKMMTHGLSVVALRAADMLLAQRLETAKERKSLAKSVWKMGITHRANQKRYVVRARAFLVVASIEGKAFDTKRFKEVERLWRAVLGDPRPSNAPALVSVCEYVRLTEDKRMCRMLAEEIDQPMATAINSPSNPPAEWWERRWKLWKPVVAEVVETLEELTGESFKDTATAKAWFIENEKTFGFRW